MTNQYIKKRTQIDPRIDQLKYVRLLQKNGHLEDFVHKMILKSISEIVNFPSDKIDLNTPLKQYGITSNLQPGIKNKLALYFGDISESSDIGDYRVSDIQDYLIHKNLGVVELFLEKRLNTTPGEIDLKVDKQGNFVTRLTGNEFFLKDHKVGGDPVLPGVVYLELVSQVLKTKGIFPQTGKTLQIDDIIWMRPLVVKNETSIEISLNEENGKLGFTISDSNGPLSQCQVSINDASKPESIDLDNIRKSCNLGSADNTDIYKYFGQAGIQYGPSHQTIVSLYFGKDNALSNIHLPSSAGDPSAFLLHPSILDSAVHSSIGLALGNSKSDSSTQVPFGADRFQFFSELPESPWAWVRYSEDIGQNISLIKFDIDICDEKGNVCAKFDKFTVRKASLSNQTKDNTHTKSKALKPLPNIDSRTAQIEEISIKILWATLEKLGILEESSLEKLGIGSKFGRWLEESINLLLNKGFLNRTDKKIEPGAMARLSLDEAWGLWNISKKEWQNNPHLTAQANLLEPCLKNLIPILQGETLATDVIFPESSMTLVENIYKNNTIADFFNESLCESVIHHIDTILEDVPNKKLRLLEIGAGTGGTSALLFEKLTAYSSNIGEYCYTDISEAFLSHARKEYGPTVPYLKYKIFNTEFSPSSQDVENNYDIVIAANVLHATHNIDRTVKNAKSVLTKNGLIAINEATEIGAYTHLTFGLLDGWWLYEDPDIRLQGAPLLSPSSWDSVLTNNGFHSVKFPVKHAQHLRLQIITANSDGEISELANDSHSLKQENKKIETADSGGDSKLIEATIEVLKSELSKILCIPSEQINEDEDFQNYGVDSIVASLYSNSVKMKIPFISAAMVYEYGSVHALAHHLIKKDATTIREIFGIEESLQDDNMGVNEQSAIIKSKNNVSINNDDIAIIGVSGRYPGANNVNEFWDKLATGKTSISEIPSERWKWQDYLSDDKTPGSIYTKWGAFIQDHDKFDAEFFDISDAEAGWMDPQERILLETAYQCLEDSGYTSSKLNETDKIGVFVGVTNGFYISGPQYFSMANRISFHFDFKGPSFAVDSACSSSLTSIHLAVESLRSGSSSCALVGGVNLILHPKQYQELCLGGLLSPDDKCRAFSSQANGFVDGEGAGVLLLKPLKRAIEDGDHIHGVIKASAINSSGRTGRYATPKAAQQISLIKEAIDQAKIDPRSISYIEAHATGTPMGDSVELMGINEALSTYTQETQFCSVGSYKPIIGYCESASGIAGITKVLLQFKHKKIAPAINCEQLNSDIDFENSAIAVRDALTQWEQPKFLVEGKEMTFPRRAGVSSLGATGSNAHVILEEYVETSAHNASVSSVSEKEIILLSAKTVSALNHRVNDFKKTIEQTPNIDLTALSYTLTTGREHLKYRVAFIVEDIEGLIAQMQSYIDNGITTENTFVNTDKAYDISTKTHSTQESQHGNHESLWKEKKFKELALCWINGENNIPWERMYNPESNIKRLSLPTYRFDGKRYWLDEEFYDSPTEKHITRKLEQA